MRSDHQWFWVGDVTSVTLKHPIPLQPLAGFPETPCGLPVIPILAGILHHGLENTPLFESLAPNLDCQFPHFDGDKAADMKPNNGAE